jgi:8-oxo-dGTP pyrophosphatase MutT (NUDIX family)
MKRFSTLKPEEAPKKESNVLYSDKDIEVIKFEDRGIITGQDRVYVLPYFIEKNKIIIRQEYIPAYKYADKEDLHLSLVGGGIEKGESAEEALLRELQEEAGVVLRPNFPIEVGKPLFIGKISSCKYYMCILSLTESDYHEVAVDKSKENKLDKAVKIDAKYINNLNASDLLVELMIEKFKKFANL